MSLIRATPMPIPFPTRPATIITIALHKIILTPAKTEIGLKDKREYRIQIRIADMAKMPPSLQPQSFLYVFIFLTKRSLKG